MIKKVLLLVLVVALGVGGYYLVTQGIKTSFLNIPSYNELIANNQILDVKIAELKNLNEVTYETAKKELSTAENEYSNRKISYDQLATGASEEDIATANQREEYYLDYLWIKIGNYATDNGVKLKMEPNIDSSTIVFDINGTYISVINFIYDIENDEELSFTVDNIIAEGTSSGATGEDAIALDTKAHFTVTGVNIITSEV